MNEYKHSVSLDRDKCKGCTTCLKRCPVEAIRIRDGHAIINSKRCIDCGECIKVCPYKAKKAISDSFESIKAYKWKIALPAPSLYGQFDDPGDVDFVLQALLDIGFDDVFEVAAAAELVTAYTRRYLKRDNIPRPIISTACPVVARLISLRFPFLCGNVLPILPPMEIAAMLARKKAKKEHPELKDEDICTCFISPCPAKVSNVKNNVIDQGQKSYVDVILSMSDVYFRMVPAMKKPSDIPPTTSSGMIGIGWATTGGEATAIFNDNYLAADGIENIIKVLEEIDNGNIPGLDFIELNACTGGCVGGAMTVANPYIAQARLQTLRRYLPVSRNNVFKKGDKEEMYIPDEFFHEHELEYRPVSQLSENRGEAMRMMAKLESILEELPAIDCGSCGSPSCRAFAEDIVKGDADCDECIVKMRERFKNLKDECF